MHDGEVALAYPRADAADALPDAAARDLEALRALDEGALDAPPAGA